MTSRVLPEAFRLAIDTPDGCVEAVSWPPQPLACFIDRVAVDVDAERMLQAVTGGVSWPVVLHDAIHLLFELGGGPDWLDKHVWNWAVLHAEDASATIGTAEFENVRSHEAAFLLAVHPDPTARAAAIAGAEARPLLVQFLASDPHPLVRDVASRVRALIVASSGIAA